MGLLETVEELLASMMMSRRLLTALIGPVERQGEHKQYGDCCAHYDSEELRLHDVVLGAAKAGESARKEWTCLTLAIIKRKWKRLRARQAFSGGEDNAREACPFQGLPGAVSARRLCTALCRGLSSSKASTVLRTLQVEHSTQ